MLRKFLENKPVFYKKIDFERFPNAYEAVKPHLLLPRVIHIVGTNGKGSTGRFLAQILHSQGLSVGHYTSPHIFDFNERFWRDGEVLSWEVLNACHERLLGFFEKQNARELPLRLSYFEWATLLAAVAFEGCDEVILEAGMGGEFDATNVFAKKMSVFTPIGLDHCEMLGESLEQIATTKLNSLSCETLAVFTSDYALPQLGIDAALSKGVKPSFAPHTHFEAVSEFLKTRPLSDFLASNLNLAYFAARLLGREIAQIKFDFDLKGRCEKIAPNLWVDVGHNPHAAKAVCEFVKQNLINLKVNLVYNAFKDKDFAEILRIFAPVINRVLVYDYESKDRELASEEIFKTAQNLGVKCEKFHDISSDENYIVFGSFMLVENFLRNFKQGFKIKV